MSEVDKTLLQLDTLAAETSLGNDDIFYAIIGGHEYQVKLSRIKDIPALVAALAAKADLVDGKVPTSQLPSYVDDVLEYNNLAAFPATGETGKIYAAKDTNVIYRWSGSAYVEISASLALGETSSTAYRGDRGKTAYDHSQSSGNAHNMTARQAGALVDDYNAYIEKTVSGGAATVDCSLGCNAYIASSSSFNLNITNVKNGMSGCVLVNVGSSLNITMNNVTDANSNAYTKILTGTFTSLAAGTYNICWSVVNLGVGKRYISINIQRYI